MGFGTFATGPYSVKWNNSELGLLEGSPREQMVSHGQDVRASQYGDSVIDGVYRGGDCFAILTVKEWVANTKAAMWPFSTADMGLSGVIGRLNSDIAKALLLTAITGTPAQAGALPATRSYPKAILMPEHSREITFGSEERNVMLVFRCLPIEVGSDAATLRWFTDT